MPTALWTHPAQLQPAHDQGATTTTTIINAATEATYITSKHTKERGLDHTRRPVRMKTRMRNWRRGWMRMRAFQMKMRSTRGTWKRAMSQMMVNMTVMARVR